MCGRFTFEPTAAVYARFQLSNRLEALVSRYNIAPGQMVPVIIAHCPRHIVRMRWGLIPQWAKDDKTADKMINARVETLTQRPAFRSLLRHHRCVVPASGFYEWKGEGRDKRPSSISPQEPQYLACAGLDDVWSNPQGAALSTVTIITTEAHAFMASLHHRMPVVLARDLEAAWLDPALTKAPDVLDLRSRSTGVKRLSIEQRCTSTSKSPDVEPHRRLARSPGGWLTGVNTVGDVLLQPAGVMRRQPHRLLDHVTRRVLRLPWASGRFAPITRIGRGHNGGRTFTRQSGDDYRGGQPDRLGACDGRRISPRRGAGGASRPQRLLGGTKRD